MAESPSRGLADVVAASTALSDIDGRAGRLFYRGYDISQLAGSATFEEIAYLLQRGAPRVAAVDVAYGQIDVRLREDPRVTVIERLNGRELLPSDLPFAPSLATIDVSFISLAKILPAVAGCLAPGGEALAMVKPQFELGRRRVGRGVVRDTADRREAIQAVALSAAENGLPVRGVASSGLPGPKGNRETFLWCGGEGPPVADLAAAIHAAVEVDK